MNSSRPSEVRPGPVTMLSTGTSRRPFAPATTQVARAAISGGTLSAAGGALQSVPERFAFADDGAGGRGTDCEAAISLSNTRDAGNSLGIDDQIRPDATG